MPKEKKKVRENSKKKKENRNSVHSSNSSNFERCKCNNMKSITMGWVLEHQCIHYKVSLFSLTSHNILYIFCALRMYLGSFLLVCVCVFFLIKCLTLCILLMGRFFSEAFYSRFVRCSHINELYVGNLTEFNTLSFVTLKVLENRCCLRSN